MERSSPLKIGIYAILSCYSPNLTEGVTSSIPPITLHARLCLRVSCMPARVRACVLMCVCVTLSVCMCDTAQFLSNAIGRFVYPPALKRRCAILIALRIHSILINIDRGPFRC